MIGATIIALLPVMSNTVTGRPSVDAGLLVSFRVKKAGRLRTLLRLRIRSGLALIGAVVAEFVVGTGGRRSGLACLS